MDHSYVQTLVDRGELTEEEANVHPQSNILMGLPRRRGRSAVGPAFHRTDEARRRADGLQRRGLALLQPERTRFVLSSLSPREATGVPDREGPLARAWRRRQLVARDREFEPLES